MSTFENATDLLVDLTDIQEDAGFEAIPEAVYDFEISESVFMQSKAGNPMIKLTLEIIGGDYEGRKLFTYVVFSEKALPMAKKTINRLGLSHLLEGKFNPATAADDFLSVRGQARVGNKMYEGTMRSQVNAIMPPIAFGEDTDG